MHLFTSKQKCNMAFQVKNFSFINYVCDFLISTFDQHASAFCVTSISNLRILCIDAFCTLSTFENLSGKQQHVHGTFSYQNVTWPRH